MAAILSASVFIPRSPPPSSAGGKAARSGAGKAASSSPPAPWSQGGSARPSPPDPPPGGEPPNSCPCCAPAVLRGVSAGAGRLEGLELVATAGSKKPPPWGAQHPLGPPHHRHGKWERAAVGDKGPGGGRGGCSETPAGASSGLEQRGWLGRAPQSGAGWGSRVGQELPLCGRCAGREAAAGAWLPARPVRCHPCALCLPSRPSRSLIPPPAPPAAPASLLAVCRLLCKPGFSPEPRGAAPTAAPAPGRSEAVRGENRQLLPGY